MLRLRNTSSLEKVFLDSFIEDYPILESEKIFSNQIFSYQVVLNNDFTDNQFFKIKIESEIADYITVREVQSVPCEMPVRPEHDIRARTAVGLYPDVLRPLNYFGRMFLVHGQTRSLWIEVAPKGEIFGKYNIKVKLTATSFDTGKDASFGFADSDEVLGETNFSLEISKVQLPPQTLTVTQWFHPDCLANYYNVEMFSKKHFEICEAFMKTAVSAGRTMMLTPLLTPALDTLVGWERPTAQLVKITKDGEKYQFDYSLMEKWLDMCKRVGVKQYEISHFFSQWGAYHAPKVMAYIDGKETKIFGWETDALSSEYISFLRQLITSFLNFMKSRGEDKKCWFHISDEPKMFCIHQYKKVKEAISDLLTGYPIMDAVSTYEFVEKGIAEIAIPSIKYIDTFIENKVENLWCYYCGGMRHGESNNHIAMTLSRTRFIGVQMYKYDIVGFLHWGYNFYYDRGSCDTVDPFSVTDGYGFDHSGDGFMVYPGRNGQPWESIRLRAFYEALEDMRALKLAQEYYGKDFIVSQVEKICGNITFGKCVNDAETMLKIRHKINELIFEKAEK